MVIMARSTLVDERPITAQGIVDALRDDDVQDVHLSTREAAEAYFGEIIDRSVAAHEGETRLKYTKETAEVIAAALAAHGFNQAPPDGDPDHRPPIAEGAEGDHQATGGERRYKRLAGYSDRIAAGLALGNPDAPGKTLDAMYAKLGGSPGKVMQAAFWNREEFAGEPEIVEARQQIVKAAYDAGVGSGGGFLLPEEMRSELLRLELEESIMLPRVTTFPMSGRTVSIPMIDVTSHASSLFGGVIVYWRGEGAAITESNANFGQVKLEPHTLAGLTRMDNELIADTTHLDAYFTSVFPPAMAYEKDYTFLLGSGVGQPFGMLNSPGKVTVAAEGTQPSATVVYENLVKMWARMLPASKRNAIWVVSQSVMPELMTMALSVGTGGSAVWMTNAQQGPPLTIFGRPVFETEKVPALGAQGDVNFIDPRFYLHGDRQNVTMESTRLEQFAAHRTSYKLTVRCDGRPWFQTALTPKNGGDTLSPVVQLAARP